MAITNGPGNPAAPVSAARALLVFHLVLLASWAVVQLYYRVVSRFVTMDQVFWFGVMSWCLIAAAPFMVLRFARERRGTSAASMAYAAVGFAIVDLVGETLQFAPQLGLPALVPSDKGLTELVVRGIWVSCEFLLRSAVFVALWRSQAGAPKLVSYAFFGLVATHWVGAMIAFLSVTAQFASWWNNQPAAMLLVRVGWVQGLTWLSILIWLNRRVVLGQYRAAI